MLLGPHHDLLRLLTFGAWIPSFYTQSPELCASRTLQIPKSISKASNVSPVSVGTWRRWDMEMPMWPNLRLEEVSLFSHIAYKLGCV